MKKIKEKLIKNKSLSVALILCMTVAYLFVTASFAQDNSKPIKTTPTFTQAGGELSLSKPSISYGDVWTMSQEAYSLTHYAGIDAEADTPLYTDNGSDTKTNFKVAPYYAYLKILDKNGVDKDNSSVLTKRAYSHFWKNTLPAKVDGDYGNTIPCLETDEPNSSARYSVIPNTPGTYRVYVYSANDPSNNVKYSLIDDHGTFNAGTVSKFPTLESGSSFTQVRGTDWWYATVDIGALYWEGYKVSVQTSTSGSGEPKDRVSLNGASASDAPRTFSAIDTSANTVLDTSTPHYNIWTVTTVRFNTLLLLEWDSSVKLGPITKEDSITINSGEGGTLTVKNIFGETVATGTKTTTPHAPLFITTEAGEGMIFDGFEGVSSPNQMSFVEDGLYRFIFEASATLQGKWADYNPLPVVTVSNDSEPFGSLDYYAASELTVPFVGGAPKNYTITPDFTGAPGSTISYTIQEATKSDITGTLNQNGQTLVITVAMDTVTVTLRATSANGISERTSTVTFVPTADASRAPVAKNLSTDEQYYYIEDAIMDAVSGNTIVLIADTSFNTPQEGQRNEWLQNNAGYTIDSGVTLLLPYKEGEHTVTGGGSSEKFPYANYALAAKSISATNAALIPTAEDYLYLELTIPQEITLTVNGKLVLGGTICSSSTITSGTAGARSNISLDGCIEVKAGGVLSSCGYIYGKGTVIANGTNTKVYQPFTVCDFRGGGYFVSMGAGASDKDLGVGLDSPGMPFTQFSMRNIQTDFVLTNGATSFGYCNIYANSDDNQCNFAVVGQTGLVQLGSGSSMYSEYRPDEALASSPYIGRTRMVLEGDASFGSMSMSVNVIIVGDVTVNTMNIPFSVPYNYDIELASGTFTIGNPLELLPGAELTVGEAAVMSLTSHMAVFDQLDDATYLTETTGTVSAYTNTYSALVKLDNTGSTFNTRKNTEKPIWSKYLDDLTDMYVNASNYGCIYVGKKGSETKTVTRWGEEVSVDTATYKTGSSKTTTTYVASAIPVTDCAADEINLVGGYAAVPVDYLVAKGLETPYESVRFGGTVVEEYGVYNDTYQMSHVYRILLEDGTYVYRWCLQPNDNITTLTFFDVAGNFGYKQTQQNAEPGQLLSRWVISTAESSDGVSRSYSSAVYYPYSYTSSTPAAIQPVLGTGDKLARSFYTYSRGASNVYEVQKADGTLAYYFVRSGVAYPAQVKFNSTGEYLNEVTYSYMGQEIVQLRNTKLYMYRDPYNTERASAHFREDGSVYYRYGSTALIETAPTVTNGWMPTISYTVPAVNQYVATETLLDSSLLLNEEGLPVGKDGKPITYDNRTYMNPGYERRTPVYGSYDLVIDEVNYGKVTYEYVDENGEVCMYMVAADSTYSYYVWKDGSVVSMSQSSYKILNPSTSKTETIYVAVKVTRAPKDTVVYNANIVIANASNTVTAKLVSPSAKYPFGDRFLAMFGNESANFIVNGTLSLESGSEFGGLIQTHGGPAAKIEVKAGAKVSTVATTGGAGYSSVKLKAYLFLGKTERTLKAQIYDAANEKLVDLAVPATGSTVYKGYDATFQGLPYCYTLYDTIKNGSSHETTTKTFSGTARGTYRGAWGLPMTTEPTLEQVYYLEDYVWFNGMVKVPMYNGTDGNISLLTKDGALELPVVNGKPVSTVVESTSWYYLVREMEAKSLSRLIDFQVKYVDANGNTYISDALTIDFQTYADAYINANKDKTDQETKNMVALVKAMKVYGDAAEDYFVFKETGKAPDKITDATKPVVESQQAITQKQNGTYQLSDSMYYLFTRGANVEYAEHLSMIINFHMILDDTQSAAPVGDSKQAAIDLQTLFGADLANLVKVGLEVQTLDANGNVVETTCYVTYGSVDGTFEDPSQPVNGGSGGNLTVPGLTKDEKGLYTNISIAFDLTSEDYLSRFLVRPYLQYKDGDKTVTIYGRQCRYGLEDYIARSFKENSADTKTRLYNNLLAATWAYANAADQAFD